MLEIYVSIYKANIVIAFFIYLCFVSLAERTLHFVTGWRREGKVLTALGLDCFDDKNTYSIVQGTRTLM